MKIICEHCGKEILDEEIVVVDHGTMHEEGCLIDYFYLQYATTYSRSEYVEKIKKAR